MRMTLVLFAVAAMTTGTAQAGSQSSNTSSDSSSNNGAVHERIVNTYCEDGYCERYVQRRVSCDDWRGGCERQRRRHHHRDYGDDD
jgi:hypothetical protein